MFVFDKEGDWKGVESDGKIAFYYNTIFLFVCHGDCVYVPALCLTGVVAHTDACAFIIM